MTTQLFDVPGPRGRLQQKILAVVLGLLTLGLLAVAVLRLAEKGNLTVQKWQPFVQGVVWREYLLPGLQHTLVAAALAIVLAAVLGLLLGLGRLSQLAPVRWISSILVEFFRAVPVLVMMIFSFWLYSIYQIFPSSQLALAGTVTGLTFYNGAVIAELIRSGVGNLPKGQEEAGLSIGLTPSQTLRSIQLPQALTAMLPALVSQLVVILKDSALGYQITFAELLRQGEILGSAYANTVPSIMVVAVIFILLNFALSNAAQWVESRLNRRGRVAGGTMTPDRIEVPAEAEVAAPKA